MALADVYDALISERVYKPAFAHEKVRNIIVEGRGGGAHFDPDVVDAFLELETTFQEVAIGFAKPTSLIRKAA
jgi:putative two-component system response regulator